MFREQTRLLRGVFASRRACVSNEYVVIAILTADLGICKPTRTAGALRYGGRKRKVSTRMSRRRSGWDTKSLHYLRISVDVCYTAMLLKRVCLKRIRCRIYYHYHRSTLNFLRAKFWRNKNFAWPKCHFCAQGRAVKRIRLSRRLTNEDNADRTRRNLRRQRRRRDLALRLPLQELPLEGVDALHRATGRSKHSRAKRIDEDSWSWRARSRHGLVRIPSRCCEHFEER